MGATIVLYVAVNFAGMYTKYLTDRGQRKAFLETHRSMETRYHTQKENDRQEKLLLSGGINKSSGKTVSTTKKDFIHILNRILMINKLTPQKDIC